MLATIVVAGVVTVTGALAAGAPASSTAPVVRVSSFAPFAVRGTRFQPSEHVHVRLESRVDHVVRVHATADGAFVAVFRSVTVERCDGFFVKAVGSKGSVAVARARPLMCASTNRG